jgi:hypothetical protein
VRLLRDNVSVPCEKAGCERLATRLYNWEGTTRKPLLLCNKCGDRAKKVLHI